MILDEKTYVDKAEKVIKELKDNSKKDRFNNPEWITTSKLRNLLAMSADIYNQVLVSDELLSDEICSRIDYLRVRFIYECGRDSKTVKPFVEKAQIIEAIKEIRNSRARYIVFSHYMEALVAYHKYYGGKDQ